MLVERAFGQIVGRKLLEHQEAHELSDEATARLARVSQSYWWRVRRGLVDPEAREASTVGARLLDGLAVSMPDLLREAIDEVQALKAEAVERLREAERRRRQRELAGAGT